MEELKIRYHAQRYYRDGWVAGVVSVLENFNEDNSSIEINKNYSIRGTIGFEPLLGKEYKLHGELVNDANWGQQIELYSLREMVQLDTDEDKKAFLEQMLTPLQVEHLYQKYDDPFEILAAEDIPALMEVEGIGEKMAIKLISRFQSTVDDAPAYIYFKKFDITNTLIKKLLRVYGGSTSLISQFKEDPYILMDDVDGIGFIKADEIALKSGIQKKSELRIRRGLTYLFSKEADDNGCTWVSSSYFKTNAVKILNIPFDDIKEIFKEMVEEKEIYVDKKLGRIALYRLYNLEQNVAKQMTNLQSSTIDDYNKEEVDNKINDLEAEQGFEFTDEQREGIHKVLQNNIAIISGNAGTGKTTVVKGFLKVLNDTCNVALTSLSGQASKRMSEATGYPASTIHRLLGYVPGMGFTYDEDNCLPYDVVVLDECSMLSVDVFWILIRAMRDDAKLIILGDNKQLPPIGVGNLFTDLLASNDRLPVQILTKIHRQAAKSAIISVSADVRNRKQIVPANNDGEETLGELEDLTLCTYQDKENVYERVIEAFREEYTLNKSIKDIQIVIPLKEKGDLSQDKINNAIQEIVNPSDKKYIQINKNCIVKEGDKVINRKNNYRVMDINYKPASVFNGSMGIVETITDDYMIIDFFDIGKLRITSDLYKGIQLAYAITCHSAQGSQWATTIVAFDYSAYILLSSEWVYTAITRAAKRCYLIAETSALRYAITTTKIKGRDTFLQDFLKENKNDSKD